MSDFRYPASEVKPAMDVCGVLLTEVVETCPAAGQPHTTMFLHRLGEAR